MTKIDILYEKALLIRMVEQKLLSLFAEGQLYGTVHTCIGQEWTGVAIAEALQSGDIIFSNHRCHGHYIARTGDIEGLVAEIMGKTTGLCGGRGGSQHICTDGVFSNGIQGGIVPVAAGMALAEKLRNSGNIAVAFIGDGTLGQGVLYETLNFISLWNIPLLVLLENNYYAQSTHQSQNLSGDICARATAFGIETAHSDTWNPEKLIQDISCSVNKIRQQTKPCFHRVDTYRLMAHSKGDDPRDPNTVKEYWRKDPVECFINANPDKVQQMRERIVKRIDSAVQAAQAAPYATQSQVDDETTPFQETTWLTTTSGSNDRVVKVIYESFKRNLRRNERIILIGEDIETPYGGAFKVTKDLSELFPGRVRNTPISEAAIVGLGNGLAINGMLPVCEIMFGDFLALAADQLLNHSSKFRYMYNDQVTVPLIIRTPMGGGRGYGPTHSQSIEKHFLGMPGTQVFAINHRYCPGKFYDALFESIDRPTIVIENKLLYTQRVSDKVQDGFVLEHTDEMFPTTRLRPHTEPDITILCYGGVLSLVEAALGPLFDRHEIACEVIVPMRLYPLNPWPIVQSVQQTRRLLVVEEGIGFAAFGSEVASELLQRIPESIDKFRRLASPPHPIPSSGPLEKQMLPGTEDVIDAASELVHG